MKPIKITSKIISQTTLEDFTMMTVKNFDLRDFDPSVPKTQVIFRSNYQNDDDNDLLKYDLPATSKKYLKLLDRIYSQVLTAQTESLKMEPLILKKIGTKKIIFINFVSVCKTLNRDTAHVMSFILSELQTTGSLGDKGFIMKYRCDVKYMEKLIQKYSLEYVQCTTCLSFDTLIKKENRIDFKCCNQCHSKRSVRIIK